MSDNQNDIAARLEAAGLRVKPLEIDGDWLWDSAYNKRYTIYGCGPIKSACCRARIDGAVILSGTRAECIAACNRHHAESVMAMLEPIPSEEMTR